MSQGLPSPPLTREEFASLRDGAKGLLHRIPAEHKAKLIELGYGNRRWHSDNEPWQNENCRRQMTDKPLKRPRDPGKLAKLMIEIGRPPTQAGGPIVVALFLCLPALARAEDKEPFASIELG